MKGIGDSIPSFPPSLMPSDWRDVDSEPNRLAEFQKKILEIADETVLNKLHLYTAIDIIR